MIRSPLQRRTPLARETSILKRTQMARGTTPLPQRSAKRISEKSARDHCVATVLKRDPLCRRCGVAPSTDVHELHRGQLRAQTYLNPDLCRGLCRPCHDWCDAEPEAAHVLGLVRWSWEHVT